MFVSGELFTGLCDVTIYEQKYLNTYKNIIPYCKNIIYVNSMVDDNVLDMIDKSFSFFVKSDYLNYFQDVILPQIHKKFILVSHNSDYTVGKHQLILNNKYLVKWFGQNMIPHIKTVGIPIGLQNKAWQGWNYEVCKKNKHNTKNKLLYFNFSIRTNPSHRQNVKNILQKKGFKMNVGKKWEDYIEELSHYHYCLSPEGNGADCHRIWESIYVGCIPIVKNNYILYEHFKELPILWVEDFSIIDEKYLLDNLYKFNNRNIEKSTLKYWQTLFINLKNNKIEGVVI